MNLEQEGRRLKETLSLQIKEAFPPQRCREFIEKIEASMKEGNLGPVAEEIVEECRQGVFTGHTKALLDAHYPSGYLVFWPQLDVVGSALSTKSYSDRWHLDGGSDRSMKLFLYLNPVAEHGGNTLIIDLPRTKELNKANALPLEGEKRTEEVAPVLEKLGLDTGHLAYDLEAGDALLFDPFTLAHRRLPPREGHKRYTVCFLLVPRETGERILDALGEEGVKNLRPPVGSTPTDS